MTTTNPLGITRRTMLKATAATTAGAALFTGSASATEFIDIHFCGCSQICFEGVGAGGSGSSQYRVRVAYMDGGEWVVERKDIEIFGETKTVCYTIEDAIEDFEEIDSEDEPKIIAVNEAGDKLRFFGNPRQCAQKALDAWRGGGGDLYTNDDNDDPGKRELVYGVYDDVEVKKSNCGDSASKDKPNGPPEKPNGPPERK